MSNTKKPLITIPRLILLALLVIAIIIGGWLALRTVMVNVIMNNIKTLEAEGYEVGHAGLTMAGFPFSVIANSEAVLIRAPTSAVPDPTKNWAVKLDAVELRSPILSPLSWDIRHRGKIGIDMHDARGVRYIFDMTPANIDASAAMSLGGRLKHANLKIDQARFVAPTGNPPIIAMFGGLRANIKISENTAKLSMGSGDIRLSQKLPRLIGETLGRELALIELNANLENWALLEQYGAQNWMEGGGRIHAEHWAVLWGPADMVGDFNISFKNGLPEGVINIRIKRPKNLLNRLSDTGLVPAQQAFQIKGFLSLIKTSDDDRKPVQITIKDGIVKYGFIPLYKF